MTDVTPANPLALTPVFEALPNRIYSGAEGDFLEAGHRAEMALSSGTISLSFACSDLAGKRAILSKDGAGREDGGHLTVWVRDGLLIVTQETADETKWMRVPDFVLDADKTYHLGVTFGAGGLKIWMDGALVAAEPTFKQGIATNDRALVIGGSRAWRDDDSGTVHSRFEGEIGHVMVFGRELGEAQMLALADAVDRTLDTPARQAAMVEDLLPVIGDMHHASDNFREILQSYGATEHGHLAAMPQMQRGATGADLLDGTAGADGIDGRAGDDAINGMAGDDILQGGYGNDTLTGGAGRDILDGGHGEDRLNGGDGDDLLISRADGREGAIFHDPDRDEGDPRGELTGGKLYPDQPIPADDVLTGGAGADIFYFQTLINAKKRYIEKHTRDDGTINWHRVAGENDKLHDHWVDIIGTTDTVMDFSRNEGDRIVIEGHTTRIAEITYGDVNDDGIIDHSVIALYSEQGSGGGAHADDRLGTITVYGDLITRSDIETTARPAYGIVRTIADLGEALAPASRGRDAPDAGPPADLPLADRLNIDGLPMPVFAASGTHRFTHEDRAPLIFDHTDNLRLEEGTIAFNFTAGARDAVQVLFSKDAEDHGTGGHITAYINQEGDLTVRVQDATDSHHLKAQGLIETGQSYDFAFGFGARGIEMLLDGVRVGMKSGVDFDMTGNAEHLIVGAGGWGSTSGETNRVGNHFNGRISDFVILDRPMSSADLRAAGFGTGDPDQLGRAGTPEGLIEIVGSDGADVLQGTSGDDRIFGERTDTVTDATVAQVYRLYQATLGRDPDVGGLLQWSGELASKRASIAEVAGKFAASAEFSQSYGQLDDGGFVTLLYQNVLGRQPDAAGFGQWMGALGSGGASRAEIVAGFSQSREFVYRTELDAMRFTSAGLRAEFSDDVFRLYNATLGRDPDARGFFSWTEELADGMTFETAIGGFTNSREFRNTYGEADDSAFLTLLYANVLERAPDADGAASWKARLESGDWSRENVVAAFAQSREFRLNSADALTDWMRRNADDDTLNAGAGTNLLMGGIGSDTFVFGPSAGASANTVVDLEAWDFIDLRGFDYAAPGDALANFAQRGDAVVFRDGDVSVVFDATDLGMIEPEMLLI